MRIRLTDGTREVEIKTEGADDEPALLRQIERSARRLLNAMPRRTLTRNLVPFGFGRQLDGVALNSSHERSDQDAPEREDEDEDDEP
ncbi:hypothetical protein AB0J38_12175 [Streptomyces sp. NPDC050095]|uniref:hypothetical protein n=1 Tax=unclassified Streptomyces TaxID=2593676 RepID=UPI00341F9D15